MEHKIGNFSVDFANVNRPDKIQKIRKTLSEVLEISIDRVIEKETDKDFQKLGKGDYILINKYKQEIYVEWKSNSFKNWHGYKEKKRVLFETHSNTNKQECGENLFSTRADLWAHSFWNKEDTEVVEVLLYRVKPLREYLNSRMHTYRIRRTQNKGDNGDWLYATEWILVHSRYIKKFLFRHYIKKMTIDNLFWNKQVTRKIAE